MTPIYKLQTGAPIPQQQRNELFYNARGSALLQAILQTLQEEAFNCLGESTNAAMQDNQGEANLMMGGFTQISKVACFIAQKSDEAPPMME
jgi:hypothetical protein